MNGRQRHLNKLNKINAKKRLELSNKIRCDLIHILKNNDFSGYDDAPKEITKTMKYLYQLLDQEFNTDNDNDNCNDSNDTINSDTCNGSDNSK